MFILSQRCWFVVLVAIAAVVVAGSGLSGLAQQQPAPIQAPGGPFQLTQQNDTVGKCNGNRVTHDGQQCDAFQNCNPVYTCATVVTPCPGANNNNTVPRRKTLNTVTYGYCVPRGYQGRKCHECKGMLICEIIRGYAGLGQSGNCFGPCQMTYKKLVENVCR